MQFVFENVHTNYTYITFPNYRKKNKKRDTPLSNSNVRPFKVIEKTDRVSHGSKTGGCTAPRDRRHAAFKFYVHPTRIFNHTSRCRI